MDIDFSLVLVNLVLASGLICLLDIFLLLPRRKTALANFRAASNDKEDSGQIFQEPLAVEYAKSLFPVFLIVLVFRSFVAEPFTIPSESMLPTLRVGDYILVNKFHYGLRLPVIGTKIKNLNQPERGDIMVFKYPGNTKINYIKRVVGLPGDEISYENKRLTINGEKIVEELTSEGDQISYSQVRVYEEVLGEAKHLIQKRLGIKRFREAKSWVVPEGHYFVMGDNRDNSNDSRFWGTVPDELVVGKAYVIWMNKMSGFHLPSFSRNRVLQ